MRFVPKTVQTLITSTPDATRVRDGLTQAIQPVLDFLNTYLAIGANGALRVLGGISVSGALSATAASFTSLAVTGASQLGPVAATSVASTGPISGTTIGGTTVTGTTSVVSGAGFKTYLYGGCYINASYTANTTVQCQYPIAQGTTVSSINLVIPMPFAGSLVGIGIQYNGATSGARMDVTVNKSNGLMYSKSGFFASVAPGITGSVSLAKGSYPFNQGDFITTLVLFSTAGAVNCQVHLFVELGA